MIEIRAEFAFRAIPGHRILTNQTSVKESSIAQEVAEKRLMASIV